MKRSFFDDRGNKKLAPILISFTFFLVVLVIDYIVRNQEVIFNYFRTMDKVIIFLLLLSIFLISFIKVMYTRYDENVDDFTVKIRVALDGSILFIAALIGIMLLVVWVFAKLEITSILRFIRTTLDSSVFITIISILLSISIVLITYSMIENLYIMIKILIDKLHSSIDEFKDVYSIFIAILALLVSIFSFFNN